MPARPFLARTPLLLHAASCAGDHVCQCVHALALLIVSSLGACAQAQRPRQPGQRAGCAAPVSRSQQRRSGVEFALLHPLPPVAAVAMSFFNGCPYISLLASAAAPAAPLAQSGTAGRLRPPPSPPATLRLSFFCSSAHTLYRSCDHCKYNGPRCHIQHFTHATEKQMLWSSWF